MTRWRAWYTNGRRFSSADSVWAELPSEGCVSAVQYHDPPYRDQILDADRIWMDGAGVLHRVPTHPVPGQWSPPPAGVPPEMVKTGAGVDDEEWAEVQREMLEAPWP